MAANTLTGTMQTVYAALDTVSRERIGFAQACRKDVSVDGAAAGATINFPIVPTIASAAFTPTNVPADPTGVVVGYDTMTLGNSKKVSWSWTGEETKGIGANGTSILQDQFQQAFRTLSNEIELSIATAADVAASRAIGTAGTTPFGTADDLSAIGGVQQILDDNGAPVDDRYLIVDNAAINTLRTKQGVVYKANESGNAGAPGSAAVTRLMGINIGQSGQVKYHTAGTGSGWAVNLIAGYAAGTKTLLIDGGSGTMLAGDVFSNTQSGRDANKYVVKTALAAGTIVLQNPGTLIDWVNDDTVGIAASHRANIAFHKNAIVLGARPPMMPMGGDLADDATIVVDPVSGIPFRVAIYKGYGQLMYEVQVVYGVKVVKPEHVAKLLG